MKKLLFFCTVVIAGAAHGQTDPLYAQYLNNPVMLNPAYSGFRNHLDAALLWRKQWASFDGSPETKALSLHTTVMPDRMGAGLIVVRDDAGVSTNTEILATYAYGIAFEKSRVTFGLQAGMAAYRTDFSKLDIYDPDGPEFAADQRITKPSFGAGLTYSSDRWFFGLSVPRLLKTRVDFDDTAEATVQDRHFYMTGSVQLFVSDRVRLKPSLLLRAVPGAPLSADMNVTMNIDERFGAGVFTRNLKTIGLQTQLRLSDRYRLGYVLELPVSDSAALRFTSHEVSLGISLAVFDFHDVASVSSF